MAVTQSKKASVLADLDAVRSMIRRHKFNDLVFAGIGLIALMIGLLTLLTLFVDLVMDGYPRFNLQFFSDFPSRRAGSAGLLSAWVHSRPCELSRLGRREQDLVRNGDRNGGRWDLPWC